MSNVPSHSRARSSHRNKSAVAASGRRTHGPSGYLGALDGSGEVFEQATIDDVNVGPVPPIGPGSPSGQLREGSVTPIALDSLVQEALADDPTNMLINGGGERGIDYQLPTGWLGPAGNGIYVDPVERKYGSRSIGIDNTVIADSYAFQEAPVLAGVVYILSGWIKTTALPVVDAGIGAAMNIDSIGAGPITVLEQVGGGFLNPEDIGVLADGVAHDWTFVFVRLKFGLDGLARIHLQLGYNGSQSGKAWFDGVRFSRVMKIVADDIVAGSVTTDKLAALAVTAAKLEIGAISGKNMLKNGGFRSVTGVEPADWGFSGGGAPGAMVRIYNTSDTSWTLRDGDIDGWAAGGPYGSSAYLYGTATATLYFPQIWQDVPVTEGEWYSCSGLLGLHRLTAAYIKLSFFDRLGVYLGSGDIYLGSLGSPSALSGGADRGSWNYVSGTFQAPVGAAMCRFNPLAVTPNTSGGDWYLFMDQMWMGIGKTPRSYDPRESVGLRNDSGNVVIDTLGVHIKKGQLDVEDQYGLQGVMTGAGFAGSWLDYLSTGFYNANFGAGLAGDAPATLVGTASTLADYVASLSPVVPYWVVEASPGTVQRTTDAASRSGTALELTATAAQDNIVFQDVPVAPGGRYTARIYLRADRSANSAEVYVYGEYRDKNHASVGSATILNYVFFSAGFGYRSYTDNQGNVLEAAPATAAFLRVRIKVVHAGGTGTSVFVSDVSLKTSPSLGAATVGPGSDLTLSTTVTDVGGSLTVPSGHWLALAEFDVDVTVAGNALVQLYVDLDGVQVVGPKSHRMGVAATPLGGQTMQTIAHIFIIQGGAAGVVKLRAAKSAAVGTMIIRAAHTSLTMVQLA